MFIKTKSERGDWINITEIVRLWEDKESGYNVAELRDGRTEVLFTGPSLDDISRAACPMVPAQSGFELLTADYSDEGAEFSRQPIIGWRFRPSGPGPVVADESFEYRDDTTYETAVKFPDGQVAMLSHSFRYENETAWRAEIEKFNRTWKEQMRTRLGV
jgi:hypothetical protein